MILWLRCELELLLGTGPGHVWGRSGGCQRCSARQADLPSIKRWAAAREAMNKARGS